MARGLHRKAYKKAWAERNREKMRAAHRRWYARRTAAERAERERLTMLRHLLQRLDSLAAKVAKPCDCSACRAARARENRRARRAEKKALVVELKGTTCQGCGHNYSPDEIAAEARKCIGRLSALPHRDSSRG